MNEEVREAHQLIKEEEEEKERRIEELSQMCELLRKEVELAKEENQRSVSHYEEILKESSWSKAIMVWDIHSQCTFLKNRKEKRNN